MSNARTLLLGHLSEAETIESVMAVYREARRLGATEIRRQAERRVGEMLVGRAPRPPLKALGITYDQSLRWQRQARGERVYADDRRRLGISAGHESNGATFGPPKWRAQPRPVRLDQVLPVMEGMCAALADLDWSRRQPQEVLGARASLTRIIRRLVRLRKRLGGVA